MSWRYTRVPLSMAISAASILPFSSESLAGQGMQAANAAHASDAQGDRDPTLSFGTIGGAASLAPGRAMQAFGLFVQYEPSPWLAASIEPSLVRATAPSTTGRVVSSAGLADLPLSVQVSQKMRRMAWAPEISAGVEVTLPTGDTAQGLGSGQLGTAGEVGLGVSPGDKLSVDLDAWHPFSGAGINAALDATSATSLGAEATYDWTDRWSTTLGYTGDVGRADSGATLPQSIAAGLIFKFAGPLALTVDAAHGVTASAPRWLLSLGIGTAFEATNPLGPNSLIGRLRQALGRGVNRGHGQGNVGGSCRGRSC